MLFSDSSGVPNATYRLQLRKEFPFPEAARIVPYLRSLGASHCYTSPILMSAAGSTHGYDVNDYHRIDVELGGHAGFEEFSRQVQAHGMGIVLDFVPNHMGIEGSQNRWWRDVLECGLQSPYADFFDIDWTDVHRTGCARVLVPILGDHYGVVLEQGKFALEYAAGVFELVYEGMRFPLRPETYAVLLAGAAEAASCPAEARASVRSLADAFYALSEAHRSGQTIQRAARTELRRELARATEEDARVLRAIASHLERVNGRAGAEGNFDALDAVLDAQHYRLAHWHTGAHEVNYRRFFAIDTLIGLRMENPKVFEETHRWIGGLIRAGQISALRIDHIDGLRNPQEYLERVQALAAKDDAKPPAPFYVVVEKILADGEQLDGAWRAHGTTGYEFIPQLAGLFVDPAAEKKLTALYARFSGEARPYAEVVYAEKRHVLEEMFANAVTKLAHRLADLVAADRRWRDLTRYELTVAIREIVACLRVYRIYRRLNAACRPQDTAEIERACAEAITRNPRRDAQPFEFVRDLLIGRYPAPSAAVEFRVGLWQWVLTFQQYTGAVMAKAVEDTSFYVYNRFVALNEVGGNPAVFGRSVAEFHAENAQRRATAPHSMLATSTHDTKFGEDVRARLYALSEIPDEWAAWAAEWRELNRAHKTMVDGREAPDANEEFRLYQTLLGCWPAARFEPDEAFRLRLREHLRKAVNEAKRNTHWLHPNAKWVEACDRFSDALLTPGAGNRFLASFTPKAERLARLGLTNALAQVVLKVTAPGVPDFYQGTERWNFTLVDPDNRRLIDWSRAEDFAQKVRRTPWPELLEHWEDGGIKLRLTETLLRFRDVHPALFQVGEYAPLTVAGALAEHIVGFSRQHGDEALVVVVPRLTAGLGAPPLGEVWRDTKIDLPSSWTRWRDVVTGGEWGAASAVSLARLFREVPFAVLEGPR